MLAPLAADLAVVQECAQPDRESERCLWFGDNPTQGIAILSSPLFSLARAKIIEDVPRYVVPIVVSGPVNFTLFAVWTKASQQYRYVRGAVRAVELYRHIMETSPSVLAGDFNSNLIWDDLHPVNLNHSALLRATASLGLTSAYHEFFQEAQGQESRPTYFHRRARDKPFHLDFCFIPEAWLRNLRNVEVGGYEDWKAASDHRPLVVDLAL